MPHEYGHTGTSDSSRVSLNRVSGTGQVAPPGFHFMPDGTLMSDAEHERLYGNNIQRISGIKMSFLDLSEDGDARKFIINGTSGAVFSLEIKSGSNYYNFITNQFQSDKYKLDKIKISNNSYEGVVIFPAVTAAAQYDIYLWAETNTKHTKHVERRFQDGSINLNASKGSNSLLVQKVIYQYTNNTLTMSPFPVASSISGTNTNDTLDIAAGKNTGFTSFEMKWTASGTDVFSIVRQPEVDDFIAFTTPTVGNPVQLPGENIYPTAREAFTGDDVNGAVTSGSVVRMDNTDLSAVIAVGDKITATTATDTVDGAVSSSNRIVMDSNVAAKMAVGDQVTGAGIADTAIVTVTHLNPDSDNAKELQVSEAVSISDGVTLTFSSKVNRDLTTVTAVETEGTATDFTMSQAIQFRDNQPLTFTPQKNHQWEMSTTHNLSPGMILHDPTKKGVTIAEYKDVITTLENTIYEKKFVKNREKAIRKLKRPTVVKGKITDQDGTIIFNKQQLLTLTDATPRLGGYGEDMIYSVSGYKVKLRNLKVELNKITTTTTSSTIGSSSTSVAVAARAGALNSVTTIDGIGIDKSSGLPTVSSGAGATGAGTLVLSAAQELENGITLTLGGTGTVVTMTGEIQVLKAPSSDFTLRLDIARFIRVN
jgi:hypothetical protein